MKKRYIDYVMKLGTYEVRVNFSMYYRTYVYDREIVEYHVGLKCRREAKDAVFALKNALEKKKDIHR